MPANPISFRPSDETSRQLTELESALYGDMPANTSQILTRAIDRLHAAVCRDAKPVLTVPKTRTRKES